MAAIYWESRGEIFINNRHAPRADGGDPLWPSLLFVLLSCFWLMGTIAISLNHFGEFNDPELGGKLFRIGVLCIAATLYLLIKITSPLVFSAHHKAVFVAYPFYRYKIADFRDIKGIGQAIIDCLDGKTDYISIIIWKDYLNKPALPLSKPVGEPRQVELYQQVIEPRLRLMLESVNSEECSQPVLAPPVRDVEVIAKSGSMYRRHGEAYSRLSFSSQTALFPVVALIATIMGVWNGYGRGYLEYIGGGVFLVALTTVRCWMVIDKSVSTIAFYNCFGLYKCSEFSFSEFKRFIFGGNGLSYAVAIEFRSATKPVIIFEDSKLPIAVSLLEETAKIMGVDPYAGMEAHQKMILADLGIKLDDDKRNEDKYK